MEEREIWKPIPHYEGIYEASNLGRIRTCGSKTTFTQLHGIRHWKQRVIKQKGDAKKGLRVSLWKDGTPKDWLVARLIAMAFYGESTLTVNHIDGNRLNNRAKNLEWCTLSENIKKGFETGLYKKNQKSVIIIDKNGKEFFFQSYSEAERFLNIKRGLISTRIKRGKTYVKTYKIKLPSDNRKPPVI